MRRRLGPLIALALLLPFLAVAPTASAEEREASGEILVPNPGVGRAQRCAATTGAGTPAEQGVLGFTLDVTPGNAFALTADDPSGAQDFDITFYKILTPCEEGAAVTDNPHENVDGDEFGIVPADAQTAAVTLHRGTPGASFTYDEEPAAADPAPSDDVTIAVIDTGARASHQEFDYSPTPDGHDDTASDPNPDDQIVAWWDFTAEDPDGGQFADGPILPEHGDVWYPRVADPFDGHGHGTATASLAAGGNADPIKDRSFAPGYELAIAKVGDASGTVTGDITEALRWATETVDADVVNMSIGAAVPIPETLLRFHEYARFAREHGTFVVVSNGNGFGGAALVPGDPGWAKPYGNSTNTFAVGASGHVNPIGIQTGYQATTDPEVTAKFTQVSAAAVADPDGNPCDDCYAPISGTSFSSPLVAGMAARLLEEAASVGDPLSLEALETLLEHSARDTQAPPNDEGYGRLDYHQMADVAIPHAQAGTDPGPNTDLNRTYVENVRDPLSATTSDGTDDRMEATGLSPENGAGTVGTTGPSGASEGEIYTLDAQAGDVVRIAFEYTGEALANDIDLYAFEGTGPPFLAAEQAIDRSTNGAPVPDGPDELVEFEVAEDGPHSLVVLGWLVFGDQGFGLDVTVDGAPATLGHEGDHYLLHTYGL